MKLTDVLAEVLKENNIKHVFGLQGGAVVHIFDSLERKKIGVTYTHHEQAASLAAVAYAKTTNNIGCTVVTTGPACTNAMTGLLAAWQDSIPCIFISGQARAQHTSYNKKVRQVGTQEVNICDIVKPITKYSKFIKKKDNFLFELRKAIDISKKGRPGPVWLDVPLDNQFADIKFTKKKFVSKIKKKTSKNVNFEKYLKKSLKPLLILGHGIRTTIDGEKKIKNFIKKHKIPFVLTWNSADLFSTEYNLNLGIIGMSGQRGANKAVFESDLILCLGNHLSIPHTTTLFKNYAPRAKKIIVNIDKNQLNNLNVKFDFKINQDIGSFLDVFKRKNYKFQNQWRDYNYFKEQNWYSPKKTKFIDSNIAVRYFTKNIKQKKCIIVDGGGTALYAGFQSSVINKDDRIICSSAISAMGTGLAESLGASKSNNFKKYICIIGDGSFLMNIQDLQSIIQEKIDILIVIVNNNGYLAIRHTQKEFLKSKYFGTHPDWKLQMPSFKKLSKGFGIKYFKIKNEKDLNKYQKNLLHGKGPRICELIVDENQSSLFKQGYKSNPDGTFSPQPLSEMHPFLNAPIANTNN